MTIKYMFIKVADGTLQIMNKRLPEILAKNAEWEKETPYNFCDRWCERCAPDKQILCKLYLDELEQKITCIAHGREPDDAEMITEVMEKQYEALEKIMEEFDGAADIDPDIENNMEQEEMQTEIKILEHADLLDTAEQYHKKAHALLEKTFYNKTVPKPLNCDFENLAWYHTLLPVKLKRALNSFCETSLGDDVGLCDAVAQFEICKKAVTLSLDALRKIQGAFPSSGEQVSELMAILHKILGRIQVLEESI